MHKRAVPHTRRDPLHFLTRELIVRNFTSTELTDKTGDGLVAVEQEPVIVYRHIKSQYVLLTTQQFEQLNARTDQRRSQHLNDMIVTEAEQLIAQLGNSIAHA